MFINTIIDEINLKNMPEVITDFFRKNGEKKFNNLRNFYDNLLKYVSEDIRDSYLNRILKYLSSEKESNIGIIDDLSIDFNNGFNVLTGETGAGKTLIIDSLRNNFWRKILQRNDKKRRKLFIYRA